MPEGSKLDQLDFDDDMDVAPRKRVLKRLESVLDSDEEDDDMGVSFDDINTRSRYQEDPYENTKYQYNHRSTAGIEMQEAFQVGCSPEYKQKKCLNWTLLGTIVSTLEESGTRMIDITLNDNTKTQPKRMTDHFGFTKAALGELGAVFASEVDETVPATVFYRPFDKWTSNSEWRIQLDYSEQILGLSIGSQFVSVATDQFTIRIITTGGIQCGLISLPGPFVCSSAYQDKLVI